MKKNMIALAVAGALVAPVAMAEVTVSGGLQAELVQIGGSGSQANGLYAADAFELGKENAGNYGFLKFSASEDLGGGMKALAMYNMNANVGDSNKAGFDTRDAYVGLSAGAFGTILAGTLSTPYKSSTVGWDPMLMTSFQARGNGGMSALHNGYASNAIAYANSFAGGMVKVVLAVVMDETSKDSANTLVSTAPLTINGYGTGNDKTVGKHAKSLSINVAPMTGLDIAFAYLDASEFGDASALGVGLPAIQAPEDAKAMKLGVKYATGPFSVAFQHERLDEGLTVSGDAANIDYLTASFKFDDANSISVAGGKTSKDVGMMGTGGTATNPTLTLASGADDAKYYALSFNHAFSKNTSAYVGYRVTDYGTVDTTSININTMAVSTTLGAETKESAVGAGLRVAF
jgi:predicted porin